MKAGQEYIPVLRFRWLTRLYDPLVRATTKEAKVKRQLVEQAAVGSGRVLDLGCGTATLTILLKKSYPHADAVGLDGDPDVLGIARRKVNAAGVDVTLVEGMAHEPPLEPRSFDRVVSSLVFHHLTLENKRRALASVHRLLKSGGELHLADWGRPQNTLMLVAFYAVQLLDGFETTRHNVAGRIPELMQEAGFEDVSETHREMTMFGTLSLYRGKRSR